MGELTRTQRYVLAVLADGGYAWHPEGVGWVWVVGADGMSSYRAQRRTLAPLLAAGLIEECDFSAHDIHYRATARGIAWLEG